MHKLPRRILIFHGYPLRGTGSNIYTANVAKALVELGCEVQLFCQERRPESFDFVDSVGDWAGGTLTLRHLRRSSGTGCCTVFRPDIGEVLPVYVADEYEGFRAVTFPELTESELDNYLKANVSAIRDVVEQAPLDGGLANHLVMGPAILARGLPPSVPYVVKVHGSALEYTVKRHSRFLPYALEGLGRAHVIAVGSRYTAESLWAITGRDLVRQRTSIAPPGVDVEQFCVRPPDRRKHGLTALADRLERGSRSGFNERAARWLRSMIMAGELPTASRLAKIRAGYDSEGVDEAAPERLRRLNPGRHRIVAYVGKLIVSKGVDLLIAAWPLVLRDFPDARLLIVGFGSYREGLELLLRALANGDIEMARSVADRGRELEGGPHHSLSMLKSFLYGSAASSNGYLETAGRLGETVLFTGRLDHEDLSDLLPACECIVVPSTFPEAFGMVAIEGAACGVWPVVARHSGLAEVIRGLEEHVDPEFSGTLFFKIGSDAVPRLAVKVREYLALPASERDALAGAVRRAAEERWSWQGVARSLLRMIVYDGLAGHGTGETTSLG